MAHRVFTDKAGNFILLEDDGSYAGYNRDGQLLAESKLIILFKRAGIHARRTPQGFAISPAKGNKTSGIPRPRPFLGW